METIVCPGGRDSAFFRGPWGATLQSAEWETDPGPIPTWWGGVLNIQRGDQLVYIEMPTGRLEEPIVLAFEGVIMGSEKHSESG